MVSNMMTGRTILKYERKQKAGRGYGVPKKWPWNTITPIQAARAIRRKYGSVQKNKKYYHRGNGDMSMHKPSLDAKRRAKR